jgi:hypothetical protein
LDRALVIHHGLYRRSTGGIRWCLRGRHGRSAAARWCEVYAPIAYFGIRIAAPDVIRQGDFDVPLFAGLGVGRHIEVQSVPLADPFESRLQGRCVVHRHHVPTRAPGNLAGFGG